MDKRMLPAAAALALLCMAMAHVACPSLPRRCDTTLLSARDAAPRAPARHRRSVFRDGFCASVVSTAAAAAGFAAARPGGGPALTRRAWLHDGRASGWPCQ